MIKNYIYKENSLHAKSKKSNFNNYIKRSIFFFYCWFNISINEKDAPDNIMIASFPRVLRDQVIFLMLDSVFSVQVNTVY